MSRDSVTTTMWGSLWHKPAGFSKFLFCFNSVMCPHSVWERCTSSGKTKVFSASALESPSPVQLFPVQLSVCPLWQKGKEGQGRCDLWQVCFRTVLVEAPISRLMSLSNYSNLKPILSNSHPSDGLHQGTGSTNSTGCPRWMIDTSARALLWWWWMLVRLGFA